MQILAIALSLLCFIFFFFFLFTTGKSCSGDGEAIIPPGSLKLPLLGNILKIVGKPHLSLADLSRIYGSVMSLKLGCLTTVVISSPEAAKEMLKTHDHVLSYRISSDPVQAAGHHEFSFVWLPPFARWRFLRKDNDEAIILNAAFGSNQCLKDEKGARTYELRLQMQREKRSCGRRSSVFHHITQYNLECSVFHKPSNFATFDDSKTSYEFQNVVIRMMEIAGKPSLVDFFPFLGFLDLQGTRKEARPLMNKLFRIFQGFIDSKRSSNASRNNNDMLDSLLAIAQEKKSELDDNDIKHLLLDLFLAGIDTSSTAVEWAMTELLRNPKMIVIAQEEIRQVIGQNDTVQELDIFKLPYLQAVVKETLRLHPPAPFLIPRKSESEDARIFELLIPKNTHVLVNVWAIGRDPSVWENPTQFKPERFLGRGIDVKGNDFELIPFGAGRRICPGMPLAFRIMHLVLASLHCSFDWELQTAFLKIWI